METKNYPFTLPNETNGGYYSMEDVLKYLGAACLTNDDHNALVTVISGDRSAATLATDAVVDVPTSGLVGVDRSMLAQDTLAAPVRSSPMGRTAGDIARSVAAAAL